MRLNTLMLRDGSGALVSASSSRDRRLQATGPPDRPGPNATGRGPGRVWRPTLVLATVAAMLIAGAALSNNGSSALAATGTLDQSQESSNANVGWGLDHAGQVFTPAVTGLLTRVDLYLNRSGATGISVYNVDANGLPTGPALASAGTTTYGGWCTFTFTQPPYLIAEKPYALVLDSSDIWYYTTWDSYSRGYRLSQAWPSGAWSRLDGDWTFHTYMYPANVYHVAPGGLTTGSCNTWGSACALSYALGLAEADDQIWIAEGRHTPDTTGLSDPRAATFQLKNGVTIYGGFAGTEVTPSARTSGHESILSGDLNGDDGAEFANNDENAYHVVTGSGTDATAILDSVIVSGGNADSGAGMLIVGGSPTVNNAVFTGNSASGSGGGMLNDSGSPTLTNVTFTGNTAGADGGGMMNQSGHPTLHNVTFTGNSATSGGGMTDDSGTPVLDWATFDGNSAHSGGGLRTVADTPWIAFVTFTGNTATSGNGGGLENEAGSPGLDTVSFTGNTAAAGGGMSSIGGSTTLANITFSGNTSATFGGGMLSGSDTSTLINVTFSGNTATSGGGMASGRGDTTLTNVTFTGNTAPSGGGIHNSRGGQTTVTNSILWGDTGGEVVTIENGIPAHQTSTTLSYSDIEGSGGSGDSWDATLGADGGGNIDADPLLGTLGRYPYNARTQTVPLLPGSAAINALASSQCPTFDQRGITRPQPTGGGCDMGAFEEQPAGIYVWGGTGQSTMVGHDFPSPLSVEVSGMDPVAGGKITFTAPEIGASATISPNPAIIGASGRVNVVVTATANGIVGTNYRVNMSAPGAVGKVNPMGGGRWQPPWFSLTNLPKNTPTFGFDLSGLPAKTYGDASFSVADYATKPADDNGAITFRTASDSAGCTVSEQGEVTITEVATGTSMCTIEASLVEDHDYLAAGPISQSFNIAPATLTVTPSSGQSMVYGSDPPENLGYALSGFVNDEADAALRTAGDLSGEATCSAGVSATSPVDVYPITCTTGTLSASNYTFAVSEQQVTFSVTPATLTVTADNQSVQYSDPLPVLTYTITGFVNDETLATSGVIGAPSLTTTAEGSDGNVRSGAGSYPITVIEGTLDASNYVFALVDATLTVNREDASVSLDPGNPISQEVTSPGSGSWTGTLEFTVRVQERVPDVVQTGTGAAGDISNTSLTASLVPVGSGAPLALTCDTETVTGSAYAYTRYVTYQCSRTGDVALGTYEVDVDVDGVHYTGGTMDAFTVYDPTLGFATGGGSYLLGGEKVNFGFTMKYNKSGSNLQGNLIAVRHHADGTVSRLKSNALGGLAIQSIGGCGIASFNGKATYTTWDPSANSLYGAYVTVGNQPFAVYAQDCNQPGTGTGTDKYWMMAPGDLNSGGNAATSSQLLIGGNIAVPHRAAR